jgi:hypothetical protein
VAAKLLEKGEEKWTTKKSGQRRKVDNEEKWTTKKSGQRRKVDNEEKCFQSLNSKQI